MHFCIEVVCRACNINVEMKNFPYKGYGLCKDGQILSKQPDASVFTLIGRRNVNLDINSSEYSIHVEMWDLQK